MKLLLDTEAILWTLEKDSRLSTAAEQVILQADVVYISPISFFEIAIKLKISRKIRFSRPVADLIYMAGISGFTWLPQSVSHLSAYERIPLYEDHRDPFDRMILATALADGLTIVSSDRNFPRYNALVPIVW